MDTLQAIATRRSIRRYTGDPIPRADLDKIILAAQQAPSARNRQPWHFVLVQEPTRRAQVAQACRDQSWLADAAYILVGVALPEISEKWCVVDTTIAMQNVVLAATSLGYGTCWIGAFVEEQVKELVGIPDEQRVVALLPIGVPADMPDARDRKPISELFSAEKYGNPLNE